MTFERPLAASEVPQIRSPKRRALVSDETRSRWFPYYAGFSAEFVSDALRLVGAIEGHNPVVLDPWLGAGTSAELCAQFGYSFRGFDINPAMLVVARARTITPDDLKASLQGIERVSEKRVLSKDLVGDPLEQWFEPASAANIRAIAESILRSEPSPKKKSAWLRATEMSPRAAFQFVALFRTVRDYLSRHLASNPTWVKIPDEDDRIEVSAEVFTDRFLRTARAIHVPNAVTCWKGTQDIRIERASSANLPLKAKSVDAIIGSPPYCTRIDYVKATLPELAVIGFPSGYQTAELRRRMIGTPTMHGRKHGIDKRWGVVCSDFLRKVESHDSKASRTYYSRYFRQYFDGMYKSLVELNRVLRAGGKCVLVVQDSFYKDIHNDLPAIFCEIGTGLSWKLERRIDFGISRTLAGINPTVKSYRETFNANEAVLIFEK